MNDANARRHDFESRKCLRTPLQKLVTFAIAFEFHFQVALQRVSAAGEIDLHGMIHYQVHGYQRLDNLRVFSQSRCCRTHRGQVHQQRHTREILQNDARDNEWDFIMPRRRRLPLRQRAHAGFGDLLSVEIAQHRFQHYAKRDGQARDGAQPGLFQSGQRIEGALSAVAEIEFLQRIE